MRSIRLIRKKYIKSLLGHFFSVYYVFFVHILFMLIMYNKKCPIKVKLLRNNFPSNRLLRTILKIFYIYIQHLWGEKIKNVSSLFYYNQFILQWSIFMHLHNWATSVIPLTQLSHFLRKDWIAQVCLFILDFEADFVFI